MIQVKIPEQEMPKGFLYAIVQRRKEQYIQQLQRDIEHYMKLKENLGIDRSKLVNVVRRKRKEIQEINAIV